MDSWSTIVASIVTSGRISEILNFWKILHHTIIFPCFLFPCFHHCWASNSRSSSIGARSSICRPFWREKLPSNERWILRVSIESKQNQNQILNISQYLIQIHYHFLRKQWLNLKNHNSSYWVPGCIPFKLGNIMQYLWVSHVSSAADLTDWRPQAVDIIWY